MWSRILRLVGLVAVAVFLGYLIGSNAGLGIGAPPPSSSPFVVSDLSIQPAVAQPDQAVTVTVTVTNSHHTWGIYSLMLEVNGVKEAEAQANVGAGDSQEVSLTVRREVPGRYAVFINGLSGSFTVVQPPATY